MIWQPDRIKDFKAFFADSENLRAMGFKGYASKSVTTARQHRFAVIASKKSVSRKAVLRNRAKRRLRAAARIAASPHFASLDQSTSLSKDWALAANQECIKLDWPVLVQNVRRFYGKSVCCPVVQNIQDNTPGNIQDREKR